MFAKPKTLAETIAENDALFAMIMGQFDDIEATTERIKEQMARDGLLRSPDAHERATDRVELAA